MLNLNRVTLVGRVGQDPEVRYLENNVAVAKFSLATQESYRDGSGNWVNSPTDWHDIVLWRNLAERAAKEIKKGKLVYIEGKVNYRKWEDKDGNPRKSTDIVARQFRAFENTSSGSGSNFPTMADDPNARKSSNSSANPSANQNQNSAPAQQPPAAPKVDKSFEEQPEDDLPF